MTFADFVQHYQLARSEGIVLRYLAGAYKALDQTVPEEAKTEELQDVIAWLGELVRQVDSSLLDEWQQLANPTEPVPADSEIEAAPPAVTANPRAFRVLVRNALFRRVELAARRQWDALGELDAADGWHAGGLGRGDGRRTSTSTTRCSPAPTPAGRRCWWWTSGRGAGRSGRSSTTRPATTTGRSPPRSTWPSPTSSAGRRCT